MEKNIADLLYLVRNAVNSTVSDSKRISEMDLDELFQISKKHSITATVAAALESAGIKNERFSKAKEQNIRKTILFDTQRSKILNFFEENGIWYVPLKGIIIKELYPKFGIRQMSDNDILVDPEKGAIIKDYMVSEGFDYAVENVGACDSFHKEPFYNYEFHRQLFDELHEDIIAFLPYFSEIKNKLIKDEGNQYGYHFSDSDFLVYITAHEFKHYIVSGTGIRNLIDKYLVCTKLQNIDFDYYFAEMEKLGIYDFALASYNLAMKLFSEDAEPVLTENEEELLSFYYKSGTYGTLEQSVKHRIEIISSSNGSGKGKAKLKYIFRRLFPDKKMFLFGHPFYRKHKWLLPFGYVIRLFTKIPKSFGRIISELKYLKKTK